MINVAENDNSTFHALERMHCRESDCCGLSVAGPCSEFVSTNGVLSTLDLEFRSNRIREFSWRNENDITQFNAVSEKLLHDFNESFKLM
jgi:hypothetical protein